MRRAVYLLLTAAVFVADQASKLAVCRALPEGAVVESAPWFWLVHWRNTGGVWGIAQGLPPIWRSVIFLALPLIGLAVLGVLFLKSRAPFDRALLAAILGGALGNLVDRIRLGSVVDFLYFKWPGGPGWPAFNVADAVLSCGLILLLFRALRAPSGEGAHAPDPVPHR